jgi:PHD and RING finger domain-containing protein 1
MSQIKREKTEPIEPTEWSLMSSMPCTSSSSSNGTASTNLNIKSELNELPFNSQNLKLDPNTNSDAESESAVVTSKKHERCPICLSFMKNQLLARPIECKHEFCLECIEEWSKKTNTCPIDRKTFNYIIVKSPLDKNYYEKKKIQEKKLENEAETEDFTYCEVCGACDREDTLLLCDGCDRGYHCECLTPALQRIPEDQWFCAACDLTTQRQTNQHQEEEEGIQRTRIRRERPVIARTNLIERVRRVINNSRSYSTNLTQSESNIIATQILLHSYSKRSSTSRRTAIPAKRRKIARRRRRKTTTKTKTVKIKQEDGSFKDYQIKSKTTKRKKKRRVTKKRKLKKKTKPFAHMTTSQCRDDEASFLAAAATTSDILLPLREPNGQYGQFYSDFADPRPIVQPTGSGSSTPSKKVSAVPSKTTKLEPITASSCGLLDSIFSSQNMLFKSSDKVEIQSNGSIALKTKDEAESDKSSCSLMSFQAAQRSKSLSGNGSIKSEPKMTRAMTLTSTTSTTTKTLEQFKIPKVKKEQEEKLLDIKRESLSLDSKKTMQNVKESAAAAAAAPMKRANKLEIQVAIQKIEDIAKVELKTYFRTKIIDKDSYKTILKKIVSKLLMGPEDEINLRKIKKMIVYYIDKLKGSQSVATKN